jgi:hypothetical protein
MFLSCEKHIIMKCELMEAKEALAEAVSKEELHQNL